LSTTHKIGAEAKLCTVEYNSTSNAVHQTSGWDGRAYADMNGQAGERCETLVGRMKQAQGITEQLKADSPVEWVQMNSIRACAMEIVEKEIIYV